MKTSNRHRRAAALLETLDLGSSIAEQDTLLQSTRVETSAFRREFRHLWPSIEKFHGGKTEYSRCALAQLLGTDWESICKDLVSIGLFRRTVIRKTGQETYQFPFVYKGGLELTRGRA